MDNPLNEVGKKRAEQKKQQEKQQLHSEVVNAVNSSGDKIASTIKQTKVNPDPNLAKTQDVQTVVDSINKLNITAFMSNQDSLESWGELVGNLSSLSDKLNGTVANIKSETGKTDKLFENAVKQLSGAVDKLKNIKIETDKGLQESLDKISTSLGSLDVKPVVNVPEAKVVVNEKEVDLKPLEKLLGNVEKAVKGIQIPKTDLSELEEAIRSTTKAVNGLSFPVPNYVLPFKATDGKATQVTLTSAGKVPVDATFTGDLTVDQVGIENVAAEKINPATEEKQDDIITAIEAIPGGGGVQYTEGDTDASITGTALVFEGAGNALVAATGDATNGLDVDVTRSALPSGASTSAKQDTIIGHIDGVETLLTAIDADTSDINTNTDAMVTHLATLAEDTATVLFNDTFEHDTNTSWNLTAVNGATIALTSAANKFMTGGQSLAFTSGTSAASELHRFMYYPPGTQFVSSEWIFATDGENMSNYAFYTSYRDATNWIRAKVLHVNSTNVWSYQDSAGAQQTLLTRDTAESATFCRWHRVYTVIDIVNAEYVTVEIDEQDFSSTVAGLDLRSSADTAVPFMLDFAIETTNTGSSSTILIDKIVGRAW